MSKSRDLASKVIYEMFKILEKNNGEMHGSQAIIQIENNLNLDAWAKEVYKKSRNVRWQSILHFFSIDCIKAGFLIRKKGVWYLTKDGKNALAKYNEKDLLNTASQKYKEWAKENKTFKTDSDSKTEELEETKEQTLSISIERAEEDSLSGFSKKIHLMDPYEFQDICSALLRGMGYYTPFVAPKGKDGGVDIVAYRDPLGALTPRVKVQVKHRKDTKATSSEVRQLTGILNSNEIGIFISSGGFSADIKRENRVTNKHIELIDLERFIELWIEFYYKMNEEDKYYMPIKPIYFLEEKSI